MSCTRVFLKQTDPTMALKREQYSSKLTKKEPAMETPIGTVQYLPQRTTNRPRTTELTMAAHRSPWPAGFAGSRPVPSRRTTPSAARASTAPTERDPPGLQDVRPSRWRGEAAKGRNTHSKTPKKATVGPNRKKQMSLDPPKAAWGGPCSA